MARNCSGRVLLHITCGTLSVARFILSEAVYGSRMSQLGMVVLSSQLGMVVSQSECKLWVVVECDILLGYKFSPK